MLRIMLAAALVVAASGAVAQDNHQDNSRAGAPRPEMNAAEAASMHVIEAVAREMRKHDFAASEATDVALKERAFRKDKRVRGWITEARGEDIVVTFVDATPAALYRVTVARGVAGPLETLAASTALTDYEAGAAQARALASAQPIQACAEKYNSVVLPVEGAPKRWTVYLLPATTKQDVVPIGGSYRVSIADGAVESTHATTKTCIALSNPKEAIGLAITHLMDPTPTEVHVFWSLWAHKSLFVATEAGNWAIEDGKVSLVSRRDDEG